MTANAPIDIEKEALQLHLDLRLQGFEQDKKFIIDAMQSLSQRIEAQTIERCLSEIYLDQFNPDRAVRDLPRLYPPSTEGKETLK